MVKAGEGSTPRNTLTTEMPSPAFTHNNLYISKKEGVGETVKGHFTNN